MSFARNLFLSLTLIAAPGLASATDELSRAFDELLTKESPTNPEPQIILNSQFSPKLSRVVTEGKVCDAPLSPTDIEQQNMDQLLVRSFYQLSESPEFGKLSETNRYFIVLLKKLSLIEDIEPENAGYLNSLTQEELLTAQFTDTNRKIEHLVSLIRAHQSLEVSQRKSTFYGNKGYTIDGYLKLAISEYRSCVNNPMGCRTGSSNLWANWFSKRGFGLHDPQVTADMKRTNGVLDSTVVRDDFRIDLPSSETYSNELTEKLFEVMNVYGPKDFKFTEYLKGEDLQGSTNTGNRQVSAPGKVFAGLMLKMANQRLVSLYKYQLCRLRQQNNINVNALQTAYSEIIDGGRGNHSSGSRQNSQRIVICPNGVCPENSVQVTSGDKPLAKQESSSGPCTKDTHSLLASINRKDATAFFENSLQIGKPGMNYRIGGNGWMLDFKCTNSGFSSVNLVKFGSGNASVQQPLNAVSQEAGSAEATQVSSAAAIAASEPGSTASSGSSLKIGADGSCRGNISDILTANGESEAQKYFADGGRSIGKGSRTDVKGQNGWSMTIECKSDGFKISNLKRGTVDPTSAGGLTAAELAVPADRRIDVMPSQMSAADKIIFDRNNNGSKDQMISMYKKTKGSDIPQSILNSYMSRLYAGEKWSSVGADFKDKVLTSSTQPTSSGSNPNTTEPVEPRPVDPSPIVTQNASCQGNLHDVLRNRGESRLIDFFPNNPLSMVDDTQQSVPGKNGWRLIFNCRKDIFEIMVIIAGNTNIPIKPKVLNPTCKGSFEWKGNDGETCRVNAEVMYYEYETSKKVGFRMTRVDPDYVISKTGQILVAGGETGIRPSTGLSLKCYADGRLERPSIEEIALLEPFENVTDLDSRRRRQEETRESCQVVPEKNWDPTVAR